MNKLTEALIKNTPNPEKGKIVFKDHSEKYLQIYIQKTTRTWYYVRRYQGKTHFIKLGEYPAVKLQKARLLAQKQSAEIVDTGIIGKTNSLLTFEKLKKHYIEHQKKTGKKSWKDNQSLLNNHWGFLDRYGLDMIRKKHIKDWYDKNSIGHVAGANRSVKILKACFNYAIKNLDLDVVNPASNIILKEEKPRERFLHPHELPKFFKALDELEKNYNYGTIYKKLFLILLFTGQRKSNVLNMKWENIMLEQKIWFKPSSTQKNNEPHAIPLIPQALEILIELAKNKTTEFVFINPRTKKPFDNVKKAWKYVCTVGEFNNLRVHDLRRTCGSLMAINGVDLQVIQKALGHKSITTTNKTYAHLIVNPIRAGLGKAFD
ncbi:site-specific integrase [Lentisphaerota bacterium WC36G]|nr:site-specific integrase [Lentisphaerae bacterium WC36]